MCVLRSGGSQSKLARSTVWEREEREGRRVRELDPTQTILHFTSAHLLHLRRAPYRMHHSLPAAPTHPQFNDTFHSHAKNNINSMKIISSKFLQKEARASTDLLKLFTNTKARLKRGTPSKEGTRCTHHDNVERKDTNRSAQPTKTCHAPFSLIVSSHHNPSSAVTTRPW